jgi:protein TonB
MEMEAVMYADHMKRRRVQPVSLGAALLVNGAMFAALLYAVPTVFKMPEKVKEFPLISIPVDPVPPPVPEESTVKPEQPRQTEIYSPPIIVPVPATENPLNPVIDLPITPTAPIAGVPDGTGDKAVVEVEKPLPVLMPALADPRYAKNFQPEYPGVEIRNNRNGTVKVRVRIGTDGRVKEVQQLSATSDAFFDATRKHALSSWRFKPATRGGVAEESWKVMNVRFEMTND